MISRQRFNFLVTRLIVECVISNLDRYLESSIRVNFLTVELIIECVAGYLETWYKTNWRIYKKKQATIAAYQLAKVKDCTFITDMIQYKTPIDQVLNFLIEEQSVLINRVDAFIFEFQVTESQGIWSERSVHVEILDTQKGREKAKFFEENPPVILNVSQGVFETHTLVVVEQTGEYKIYIIATNHPEMYEHQERSSLVDTSKQPDFSFISNTQLRAIYQTQYKQESVVEDRHQQRESQSLHQGKQEQTIPDLRQQTTVHSLHSPNRHEQKQLAAKANRHQAKVIQYQQMSLQSLPFPHNEYRAAGRNLHYGAIGIGLVAWFFTFASILWLNNETEKERKKAIILTALRDMISRKAGVDLNDETRKERK